MKKKFTTISPLNIIGLSDNGAIILDAIKFSTAAEKADVYGLYKLQQEKQTGVAYLEKASKNPISTEFNILEFLIIDLFNDFKDTVTTYENNYFIWRDN